MSTSTVTYLNLEIGETFPIAYVSKNFETGLQDVLVHIYDPNYTHIGSGIMAERLPGVYFYDFETNPSDPTGYYYFTMDSPTYSKAAAQRVRFKATAELYHLHPQGDTVWTAGQNEIIDLFLRNELHELVDARTVEVSRIVRNDTGEDVTSIFATQTTHEAKGTYKTLFVVPLNVASTFYDITWNASISNGIVAATYTVGIFGEDIMPPPSCPLTTLTGYVYDEACAPVPNVPVNFNILDSRVPSNPNVIISERLIEVYTDAQGKFTIQTYRNVNFELMIDYADFAARGKTLDEDASEIADIVLPNLI